MKIQQIRNATTVLDYDDVRFLIDPLLGDKGSYPPFPSLRGDEKNPLVDLPVPIDEITEGIDVVIVTHTHIDHWDPKAAEVLDKDIPILVQNGDDAKVIEDDGFTNVTLLLDEKIRYGGVTLTKTPAQHYTDEDTKEFVDELTGVTEAMGIIFASEHEELLYLVGDTIWYEGVEDTLDTYQPDIAILNAGGNQTAMDSDDPEKGRLLMNEKDLYEVHKAAPEMTLIASHMEAVNHWMTSRDDLKDIADEHDFKDQLLVPEDGEVYEL